MAGQLNTSVTPVREALLQLVSENVLSAVPGRSITVPILDAAGIEELRRVRVLTERYCAEQAVQFVTPPDIDELEAIHATMTACEDIEQRSHHNQNFHFTLYRLARMPTLVAMIENVWVRSGPLNYFVFKFARQHFEGKASAEGRTRVHPHVRILKALRARNVEIVGEQIERDIDEAVAASILSSD